MKWKVTGTGHNFYLLEYKCLDCGKWFREKQAGAMKASGKKVAICRKCSRKAVNHWLEKSDSNQLISRLSRGML